MQLKSENSAFKYYTKPGKSIISRSLEMPDISSMIYSKAEVLIASTLKRQCIESIRDIHMNSAATTSSISWKPTFKKLYNLGVACKDTEKRVLQLEEKCNIHNVLFGTR